MFQKRNFTILLLVSFFVFSMMNLVSAEADSDAIIGNITVTATGGIQLNPSFSAGQANYNVAVHSDIGNVVVRVIPAVVTSTITINNTAVGYGADYSVPLTVGDNIVAITATAEDGTSKTYTIKINREDIRPVANKFLKLNYVDPVTGETMPYRLFVPENYDPKKSYPLVLFLHGGGERGTDNEVQLTASQGATVWAKSEEQAKHPSFVLAPQSRLAPDGGFAVTRDIQNNVSLARVLEFSDDLKMAVKILHSVESQYSIDKKRLYSTGMSQGGFGVWKLNEEYPDLFAAMVPICGGGDPALASKLQSKPIWAFHAESDPIIPISYTRGKRNMNKIRLGLPDYFPPVFNCC